MIIMRLTDADATAAMEILHGAVCYLRQQGIDQWQHGYPDRTIVDQDIKHGVAYGAFDGSILCGVITLIRGEDINYIDTPIDWITAGNDYLTIHRIASIRDHFHCGIGHALFNFAIDTARSCGVTSIRCDTHAKNKIMRHLLEYHGFTYCGSIILRTSNEPRVAYERMV